MAQTKTKADIPEWLANRIMSAIFENYEAIIKEGMTAEEAADDLLNAYRTLYEGKSGGVAFLNTEKIGLRSIDEILKKIPRNSEKKDSD